MYRWECTYCDKEIQALTVEEVKQDGKAHLSQKHHSQLAVLFEEKWAGNNCQNGCGSWFPVDGSFSGFECPNCGHDHFSYFAGQHVWVGIEDMDE